MCKLYPFHGSFINIEEFEETRTVLVSCDSLLDEKSLMSYFSTKGRSDGGLVMDVDICLHRNAYIVTFENAAG